MKRRTLLLLAILVGNGTIALQLMQSVAQSHMVASAAIAIPASQYVFAAAPKQPSQSSSSTPSYTRQRAVNPFLASVPNTLPDPLWALHQSSVDSHYQQLAERVLTLLPVSCQQTLRQFYLLDPDTGKSRGYTGEGIIIMQRLPDEEFVSVLTHEALGHFWDINCLRGTPGAPPTAFTDNNKALPSDDPSIGFYQISWQNDTVRVTSAKPADFVTGYAHDGGPFEDLAESVSYYLLQPDAFQARAAKNHALAQKLQWLREHFPLRIRIANGAAWNGQIPWDATKLPYSWL